MQDFIILINEDDQEENQRHQFFIVLNAENANEAINIASNMHSEAMLDGSHGCDLDGDPVLALQNTLMGEERDNFIKRECEDLRGQEEDYK